MKHKNIYFIILICLLSAAFLFIGNRLARDDTSSRPYFEEFEVHPAVVAEIIDIYESNDLFGPFATGTIITFMANITSGDFSNETVLAEQAITAAMADIEREVTAGDRVLLVYDEFSDIFFFVDYMRTNILLIFGIIIFALIVLFGGKKGIYSIVALSFTCMSIFFILMPGILAGRNIYLVTIFVSVFITLSTLLIAIGPNKKAMSAALGCLGGTLAAGLLMAIMDAFLNLTGLIDQESMFLLNLPSHDPINLRSIIFAGVIIGALGAIMDVAMSISSSLWEVHQSSKNIGFAGLFKSGINIGRDILGTMLNTLILAYIGSSLSLVLVITFYAGTTSPLGLFNQEMIVVEILRALIGSFGIFLAIPLTAGICGWMYANRGRKIEDID